MWKTNFIAAVLIATAMIFAGCEDDQTGKKPDGKNPPPKVEFLAKDFSGDSAYKFIEKQLEFGPRIPNTDAHVKCAEWLADKFKGWADEVNVQQTQVNAHDGTIFNIRNIIASFKPGAKSRVMVTAHWDSRPFADQDDNNPDAPVPAANDGGSGVGVILELARQLSLQAPTIGVDFILFDAEDYGAYEVENSFCLGSQYWAKNKHKPGYAARFGINLDMVGAKNARFYQEGFSLQYGQNHVHKVWAAAHQLGYGTYFPWDMVDFGLTDDHYYVITQAGIPMVEVADYNPYNAEWFPHWHKTTDNIDAISSETLKAVGHTVLEVVYREK